MELDHSFRVPADLDTVWRAVLDPERVAPCMPGATLTETDGASFRGTVKVKLGPVSLMYKGSGEFLETDPAARRVVIKASGKDSRGNGTAAATVTVALRADGDGTAGSVHTELSITGKPAQFGRGMISEVGGKILESFAACLATKLGDQPPPATRSTNGGTTDEAPVDQPARPAAAPAEPAPVSPRASQAAEAERGTQLTVVDPAGERTTPNGTGKAPPAEAEPAAPEAEAAAPETEPAATETEPAATKTGPAAPEAEPIDLLAYAGPSVVKRVAPVLAALLAVLAIVALRRRAR